MTLCVLVLLVFVGAWVWLETQPERDEAKARADLRANVEAHERRLGRAAADGNLQHAEIARIFPPAKPAVGLVDVKRQGESTTVIAGLLGLGPPRAFIFVYASTVEGCYAFHVSPPAHGGPRVFVRQLSDESRGVDTVGTRPSARSPVVRPVDRGIRAAFDVRVCVIATATLAQ